MNYSFSWHHLLKGKFLQGKCNRCVDHLLHTLIWKTIPYFVAKHRRQALGFDGPDLENQCWTELEEGGQKIPKSDIEHLNDGHYHVHSQSDPQLSYNVHLDSSSCDCPSFPLLSFCKHIIATQLHFPSACTIIPFPMAPDAAAPARSPPVLNTPLLDININVHSHNIARIAHKMLSVASHGNQTLLAQLTPALFDLEAGLDWALPLPKKVPVAPNQHSWPETAAVMGVRLKTKRKMHMDPYSGGERSGKKAKPDTRLQRTVPPTTKIDENTPPTTTPLAPPAAYPKLVIRIPPRIPPCKQK